MLSAVDHAVVTLAVTAAVFFLLWLLSLRLRDASIVDSWWGPGFVLVALVTFLSTPGGARPRRLLVLALTAAWGLRLGAHIFRRNHGKPEDPRYQAMRRSWGERFPLVSLVTVFGLQALILWVVSAPVQVAQRSAVPATLGAWDMAGLATWAIGFFFEAVGDAQLARFRADPANAGRVMDRGLWRWTRHPNYFGDACAWWGLWLVACAVPGGWLTVVSPLVMTFLLRRVSGVPMLEHGMAKRRPGYEEYVRRTSPFVPWPPRD
ncbi:MAG: DUF1295 domain-containing protein [Alphaproteobacteria bacterium]